MALPFNLDIKDPSTILIITGVVMLAASFVSKKGKFMGVNKKTVKYGGALALAGGFAMKYMGKKKGVVIPSGPPPGVVPGMMPGNGGGGGAKLPPTTGPANVPANILPAPVAGSTSGPIMGGPSIASRATRRSAMRAAASKANFAGRNTLGTFYGDLFMRS